MDALSVVLTKPFLEITGLVGLLVVLIVAIGFAVYVAFRGLAYLHIKKIGVTGIECEIESKPKRKRRA